MRRRSVSGVRVAFPLHARARTRATLGGEWVRRAYGRDPGVTYRGRDLRACPLPAGTHAA